MVLDVFFLNFIKIKEYEKVPITIDFFNNYSIIY